MKKIIALALAGVMTAFAFAGCSGQSNTNSSNTDRSSDSGATKAAAASGDWSYIADKGEMVIGITYFEPMNYYDQSGELTGFETEFATKVCEQLGVKPKFQEIEWDSKEIELNAKTIDCIWNGLTITDERKANMDITNPYMENKQVLVTKAENVDKYSTAEGIKGATVVAEKESAGEEVAQGEDFFKEASYVAVDSQAKALLEVKSGTADAAVIDYVMSIGTLREGSDYADLKMVESQSFAPEQYGVAFRKDSPETLQKVNDAIQALADKGEIDTIAEKYSLKDLILVKGK